MTRAGLALIALLAAGDAVAASCSVAAVDLAFGPVPQLNPAPVDVQSTVTVQCTADATDVDGVTATVSYTVELSGGQAGNPLLRSMTDGGTAALPYGVYTDPAHTVVWGDGSNGTARPSGQFVFTVVDANAGLPQSHSHMAYGRVPAGNLALPGTYGDTLVVRLSF